MCNQNICPEFLISWRASPSRFSTEKFKLITSSANSSSSFQALLLSCSTFFKITTYSDILTGKLCDVLDFFFSVSLPILSTFSQEIFTEFLPRARLYLDFESREILSIRPSKYFTNPSFSSSPFLLWSKFELLTFLPFSWPPVWLPLISTPVTCTLFSPVCHTCGISYPSACSDFFLLYYFLSGIV